MPSPAAHDIMNSWRQQQRFRHPGLHGHHDRPSMVSVGTIIWLSSELMFFAALFAAYFTIRAVSPDLWAENTAAAQRPLRRGQHHDPGAVVR